LGLGSNTALAHNHQGTKSKRMISLGVAETNHNSTFGKENIGIDGSVLFAPKGNEGFFTLNFNYIDYKVGGESKNDYSISPGVLIRQSLLKLYSLEYYINFGFDIGLLHKNDIYYGNFSLISGVSVEFLKNLSFEAILKNRFNPADE
jgi:hypothetical protein